MADGPKNNEKVDWVLPVSQDVQIGSVPTANLAKAAEQHGIKFDIKEKDGKIVADVYKVVVEGMPAPEGKAGK